MKLEKELEQLKYDLGILEKDDCYGKEDEEYRALLAQGKPLPDGVIRTNPDSSPEYAAFHRIKKTSLSASELSDYIQYKQLRTLMTIKNCVVFFTVLTVISLACGVISILTLFS